LGGQGARHQPEAPVSGAQGVRSLNKWMHIEINREFL
jgi:hypothetical protein